MPTLSFNCRRDFAGFDFEVSFDVTEPVTCLLGPSGSGKTTVLGMIAGVIEPDDGRITLGGRTLVDAGAGIRVPTERRGVGCVFQDYLLFPHLSVAANLKYGQRWARGRRAVAFERVVEVLEIGRLLHRYPRHLSGGEAQRVALGRALLCRPELLLMDEPLAALDPELKFRVLGYLERIVEEWSIPVVFVTHGQAEVRRLADRVVVLDSGRVVEQGPPEDVLSRPTLLGWKHAGPVNLLRIEEIHQEDGRLMGTIGDQRIRLPHLTAIAQPLFIQFLPTDIVLSRRDYSGLSARNHLHGVIRQVVEVVGSVFVAVDAGQIIWAEVTREAFDELQLCVGAEITCLIKTQSLHRIG